MTGTASYRRFVSMNLVYLLLQYIGICALAVEIQSLAKSSSSSSISNTTTTSSSRAETAKADAARVYARQMQRFLACFSLLYAQVYSL